MNQKILNRSKKNPFFRKWSLFLGAMIVSGMSTHAHAFFVEVDGALVKGRFNATVSGALNSESGLEFRNIRIVLEGMEDRPIPFLYLDKTELRSERLESVCQFLTRNSNSSWYSLSPESGVGPGVFIPIDKNEPLQYMNDPDTADYKHIKSISCS